jgi:hypothetical protein
MMAAGIQAQARFSHRLSATQRGGADAAINTPHEFLTLPAPAGIARGARR